MLEARHGLEFIISDLIQNWLAASIAVGGLLYITSVGLIWEIILSLEKTAILP